MLGTSAEKIKYQTIHDFHSPADYLDYLFGGVQGVMYRATIDPKYYQSYYRASGLVKAEYSSVDNCYVAMNTFYRTKGLGLQEGRDVNHLKRLNAFYVDIDCYKAGLSKNEVLLCLEDNFIGSKIPVPTFIIDSGRGIYLIWKLRNEDVRALPRWTAVEQYLTDTLEELGADQACTDAARILRVPGSRNKKSQSIVKILEFNDLTYSIYDISKEYDINTRAVRKFRKKPAGARAAYPYNHATEAQRKYVKDIAQRLGLLEEECPDLTNFQETADWIKLNKAVGVSHHGDKNKGYCYEKGKTYDLNEFKSIKAVLGSYCAEIRKLFAMRKGADCKRELGLFLYRYFLREMKYDSDRALKETLTFNASLDCPFDESYVIKVTASADRRIEKGIPYAYKKSTIINILEISKEELKALPFLAAGVKSKKERKRESNRRAYRTRLSAEGKAVKKDTVMERRASILAMQEQGKSAAEIQKELEISKATYYRDIAALGVASVLEAVRAVLKKQAEELAALANKAAEAVVGAVESVKKTGLPAAVCAALAKFKSRAKVAKLRLSHFFSTPFIYMNAVGVPHGPFSLRGLTKLRLWISRLRMGDKSEDNSDAE